MFYKENSCKPKVISVSMLSNIRLSGKVKVDIERTNASLEQRGGADFGGTLLRMALRFAATFVRTDRFSFLQNARLLIGDI